MESVAVLARDSQDLLDRGFQLANFIVWDRLLAIEVLTGALNKLNARCQKERKRIYWRDKHLKRSVTKISRNEADTLQWLIYTECDQYERQQERCSRLTSEILLVRYIKYLVQITTGMSSFYVAIGLHRLVHDYGTSDTQRVYEAVTDRYLGADEYRRAKRFLMNKLCLRFGGLLRTTTVAHGEIAFERSQDQAHWVHLVRQCLNIFVPWSTSSYCTVPATFGQNSLALPPLLSGLSMLKSNSDRVEMNRCHTFIHSECFSRLIRSLGLDPPGKKLAVPEFFMANSQDSHLEGSSFPACTNLSADERNAIEESLTREADRRASCSVADVTIFVDGVERAHRNSASESSVEVDLEEGDRLIEIVTEDAFGRLVIGTHLIEYRTGAAMVPSEGKFRTGEADWRLSISVVGARRFMRLRRARLGQPIVSRFRPFTTVLARAAFALSLAGLAWTAATLKARHEVAALKEQNARLQKRILTSSSPASAETLTSGFQVLTQELTPYERTRGMTVQSEVSIPISDRIAAIRLKLLAPVPRLRSYQAVLKDLSSQQELMTERLLTPASQDAPFVVVTVPARLLTVNKSYIVMLRRTLHDEDLAIFSFKTTKLAEQ